jgi:hypothetical protein
MKARGKTKQRITKKKPPKQDNDFSMFELDGKEEEDTVTGEKGKQQVQSREDSCLLL